MKKIETVIGMSHWEEARTQLEALGVVATLRDVRTFGRSPARREVYRGSAYVRDTASELELSMLVQDDMLEATLSALASATAEADIIVTTVERVIVNQHVQPAAVTTLRAASALRASPRSGILSSVRA